MSNNPTPGQGSYIDPYLLDDGPPSPIFVPSYANTTYVPIGGGELDGNAQNNKLLGEDGVDYIYGAGGDDYVDGGKNLDFIHGDGGNDKLYGGDGNDYLYGGDGNDYLDGGQGNDSLSGDGGNDTFRGASGGTDEMSGGAGIDTVDYAQDTSSVHADLTQSKAYDDNGNIDYMTGIENIVGSAQNDFLTGNDSDNEIWGGKGDDYITGGAGGHDVLRGGEGNDYITDLRMPGTGESTIYGDNGNDHIVAGDDKDTIYGGAGDDVIQAGAGFNTMSGGSGHDTFMFQKNGALYSKDVITDFNKSEDLIHLFDAGPGNPNTPVTVTANVQGDVEIDYANHSVTLAGVHNAGYASVQDLNNAGIHVTNG